MASILNELLDDINANIASTLQYGKVRYWREAFLQTKGEETFPIVDAGNRKGYQISPNDQYELQCYHRVLETNTESDYNGGKGKYPYRIRIYTIRNVWLGNLKLLPSKTYRSIDDIKNDVYSSFPVILTNKETIKTNSENINTIEVLNEEFDGINMNHFSLDLVAFWIEYEIRQKIKCN